MCAYTAYDHIARQHMFSSTTPHPPPANIPIHSYDNFISFFKILPTSLYKSAIIINRFIEDTYLIMKLNTFDHRFVYTDL